MRLPVPALVVPLLAAGLIAEAGNEPAQPAVGDSEAIEAGRKLFLQSCAGCHGPDGSGGRGPNLVKRPLWHPLTDEAILAIVRDGIPGGSMPPSGLPEDEVRNLVAFLKVLTGPAEENPSPGDISAGASVFWGEKAGCSNCHAVHGRGGLSGPDLTNLGGRMPLAVIRESILEPSTDLYRIGSESVRVSLRDGSEVRGVARNRDSYSLQVIDEAGDLHMIGMHEVAALEISEASPMPEDYEARLSREEFDNLLAFLTRQSLRAKDGNPQ